VFCFGWDFICASNGCAPWFHCAARLPVTREFWKHFSRSNV
jgi:hypothetical protein